MLIDIQLQERLKREGFKTHKERVEELNKYLSGLTEHHDMYVLACLTHNQKRVADDVLGRKSVPVEIGIFCVPTFCGLLGVFVSQYGVCLLGRAMAESIIFEIHNQSRTEICPETQDRQTRATCTPDHLASRSWMVTRLQACRAYNSE